MQACFPLVLPIRDNISFISSVGITPLPPSILVIGFVVINEDMKSFVVCPALLFTNFLIVHKVFILLIDIHNFYKPLQHLLLFHSNKLSY